MDKKRNGEIDILRFIFAMTIVIYHFSTSYEISWYKSGGIGVEFFFILTGVLMAKHSQGITVTKDQIPNNTYIFLKRKIGTFYPYYISTMLMQLIFYDVLLHHITFGEIINKVIYGLPNLLLVQMNGIVYSGGIDIGGSWFLSAMVIALFILYPILLYGREYAAKIIFAVIGIMGFGFIFSMNGVILSWGEWALNLSRLMRATSEIALGAWGFGFVAKIDGCKLTKTSRILITAFKYICFGLAIGCGSFGLNGSLVALATTFCFMGIILSLSQKTFTIPGNRLTTFLGKISLAIYLTHNTVRAITIEVLGDQVDKWIIILIICICPIVAYVVMAVTDFAIKQFKKFKPLFIYEEN